MEARGFARARVMGACSGAHHAFHAARLDPRVVGAMMVNLQPFVLFPNRQGGGVAR